MKKKVKIDYVAFYAKMYRMAATDTKRGHALRLAKGNLTSRQYKQLLKTLKLDDLTERLYLKLAEVDNLRRHDRNRQARKRYADKIEAAEQERLKNDPPYRRARYQQEALRHDMEKAPWFYQGCRDYTWQWPEQERKSWFKYERVIGMTIRNDNQHQVEIAYRKATEILAKMKKRPDDIPYMIRKRLRQKEVPLDNIMKTDPCL